MCVCEIVGMTGINMTRDTGTRRHRCKLAKVNKLTMQRANVSAGVMRVGIPNDYYESVFHLQCGIN